MPGPEKAKMSDIAQTITSSILLNRDLRQHAAKDTRFCHWLKAFARLEPQQQVEFESCMRFFMDKFRRFGIVSAFELCAVLGEWMTKKPEQS